MTLRLGALHDALLDPGNADKAQKAAEEVAGDERALNSLRVEVRVASAILTLNTAVLLGLVWAVLRLGEHVARLTP